MIFDQLLQRLNQRYQEDPMTCQASCSDCICSPCDFLDYSNDFPFEGDSCSLAVEHTKWLNSPANALVRLCTDNPSAVECKLFED